MKFNYLVFTVLCIALLSACQGEGKEDNSNETTEDQKTEESVTMEEEEVIEEAEEPEVTDRADYDSDTLDAKYQMQELELTEVSDDDLKKFVAALNEIQSINSVIQQEMISAVENTGLEVSRFSAIREDQQSPGGQTDATADELKKFESAMAELERIQNETEERMQKIIENNGLTETRYREIGMSIQNTPELLEKFKTLVGAGQAQ